MSKQFINDPKSCVDEFYQGFTANHPGLIQLPGHRVILRRDLECLRGKVALLTGGGAGHEPAFAGFVGKGMLTGAISGDIFTSPTPSSIFAAIKAVNKFGPSGIILIIVNYTGDRLNFGLGRELAVAQGIKVEMVVIGEDCALQSADRTAGRRGLAGVLFAHKIGGALAERGAGIGYITAVLRKVAENLGTIGVCLAPCVLPGGTKASFSLGEGEMELGLGVHGEAGVKRMPLKSSRHTVDIMLEHMLNVDSPTHFAIKEKDSVAFLVNNLGATSNLEIGIVVKDIAEALGERGLNVKRIYSGRYLTSMQMVGMSLSILNLNDLEVAEDQVLSLLDSPSDVVSPLRNMRSGLECQSPTFEASHLEEETLINKGPTVDSSIIKRCMAAICGALIEKEDVLNEFDRGAGDGDCGTTHTRGARKALLLVQEDLSRLGVLLQKLCNICTEDMGGSCGAIYSILFSSMANNLSNERELTIKNLARSLQEGLKSVKHYGGAQRGDRTIIDVLEPLAIFLVSSKEMTKEVLEQAAKLSEEAAQSTTRMKAQAGRASYVNQDELKYPDAGAFAVATAIKAAIRVLLEG